MVDANVPNIVFEAAWNVGLVVDVVHRVQGGGVLLGLFALRINVGNHFGIPVRVVWGSQQVVLRDQAAGGATVVERCAVICAANLHARHVRILVVQEIRQQLVLVIREHKLVHVGEEEPAKTQLRVPRPEIGKAAVEIFQLKSEPARARMASHIMEFHDAQAGVFAKDRPGVIVGPIIVDCEVAYTLGVRRPRSVILFAKLFLRRTASTIPDSLDSRTRTCSQ